MENPQYSDQDGPEECEESDANLAAEDGVVSYNLKTDTNCYPDDCEQPKSCEQPKDRILAMVDSWLLELEFVIYRF